MLTVFNFVQLHLLVFSVMYIALISSIDLWIINQFVYTLNCKNLFYIQVDSDFKLRKVDLNLPEGPITCLDCMPESLDHVKETDDQYVTCILGSCDISVKFVRLRYGYVNKVCFAAFHRQYRHTYLHCFIHLCNFHGYSDVQCPECIEWKGRVCTCNYVCQYALEISVCAKK